MKKYRKPNTKVINLEGEQLLAGSPGVTTNSTLGRNYLDGDASYSKSKSFIFDDEFQGSDISDNNGIFRSAEENSDDATIVNHY